MKHEIEIADDVAPWGDPDEKPLYSSTVVETTDYRSADNYRVSSEDSRYDISAESIEELYEQMGEIQVQVMLRNEEKNRARYADYKDPCEVTFSDIFVKVATYDEAKMKASKKYQEVGVAREKKAQADAERERLEAIRVAKYRADQKEQHDRAEYERLRGKYEK